MDLLYSRYASPNNLMKTYIDNGRFGELVSEIIAMNNEREKEEHEKENDNKLWTAYLLSGSGKSFSNWKHEITNPKQKDSPASLTMTENQVKEINRHAKRILNKLSP